MQEEFDRNGRRLHTSELTASLVNITLDPGKSKGHPSIAQAEQRERWGRAQMLGERVTWRALGGELGQFLALGPVCFCLHLPTPHGLDVRRGREI